MGIKWCTSNVLDGVVHVWPVPDYRPHRLSRHGCWCIPAIDVTEHGKVYSHQKGQIDYIGGYYRKIKLKEA